jgi:hypothetical protein
MILGTLLMAVTFILPMAVHADSATIVYAPKCTSILTEDDVLNYYAIMFQDGYINQTYSGSQATREDRMNSMRQMATKGFDLNTTDPYLYSLLLPNNATVAQVKTWFGHPVVMKDGQYVIQGWFGPGNDAVLDNSIIEDVRNAPATCYIPF